MQRRVVPLNDRPISPPITAPPVVTTKPCRLDAVPAIAPILAIAIAEQFDAASPKHIIVTACIATNNHKVSSPRCSTSRLVDAARMSTSIAACEMRRMPSHITIRELSRLPHIIRPAHKRED